MAYLDYIRIAGVPGNSPTGEVIQGIGANPHTEDAEALQLALEVYVADWEAWWEDVEGQIIAAQAAYDAGEEVQALEIPEYPELELPVPINPGLPDKIRYVWWAIILLTKVLSNPLVKRVVREIVRKIKTGGLSDPWIRLFRKFGFLREGDSDLGYPDLTSLLLLLLDRPIEIFDALGSRDIFLDNREVEEPL
jgi:hypothetical protein